MRFAGSQITGTVFRRNAKRASARRSRTAARRSQGAGKRELAPHRQIGVSCRKRVDQRGLCSTSPGHRTRPSGIASAPFPGFCARHKPPACAGEGRRLPDGGTSGSALRTRSTTSGQRAGRPGMSLEPFWAGSQAGSQHRRAILERLQRSRSSLLSRGPHFEPLNGRLQRLGAMALVLLRRLLELWPEPNKLITPDLRNQAQSCRRRVGSFARPPHRTFAWVTETDASIVSQNSALRPSRKRWLASRRYRLTRTSPPSVCMWRPRSAAKSTFGSARASCRLFPAPTKSMPRQFGRPFVTAAPCRSKSKAAKKSRDSPRTVRCELGCPPISGTGRATTASRLRVCDLSPEPKQVVGYGGPGGVGGPNLDPTSTQLRPKIDQLGTSRASRDEVDRLDFRGPQTSASADASRFTMHWFVGPWDITDRQT